jgi:hypothetical protein
MSNQSIPLDNWLVKDMAEMPSQNVFMFSYK